MKQEEKLNKVLELVTALIKEPSSEEDNFSNEVQMAIAETEAVERWLRQLSIDDLKRMLKAREDERARVTAYLSRDKKV